MGFTSKYSKFTQGNFSSGNVNNISQVFGTCNILSPPGWLIMDAAINFYGDLLFFSNGYFGPTYTECVGVPCESKLGVAQKINDSTFNKILNSDVIFENINDTNYLVYAPQITKDGLELYYTRLFKGSYETEICVSVRTNLTDSFSLPKVIHSNFGYFPEAATPSTEKQKIYYHQKDTSFIYKIYLRYRTIQTDINNKINEGSIRVFPNPSNDFINVNIPNSNDSFEIEIYSIFGNRLLITNSSNLIDISSLSKGIYFLKVKQNNKIWTNKIVK